MSRLTRTPWDATTQTSENITLNSNPITFPVDRKFYADFTHDSVIAGVISALNLPDFTVPLPIMTPDVNRKYITSNIVPFGARLVFEEISCSNVEEAELGKQKLETGSFIRMFLNEAIIDLHQLKDCQNRKDGMCSRDEFISSLARRNDWADWKNCTSKAW